MDVSIVEEKAPIPDRELVEYLEKVYKPRCMKPGETLENHHRYAGHVELVQQLRYILDSAE